MKRNRSKAWNWILTLTFVVVMLLGMTVAVSATEYNSSSINAAGSDGIYLNVDDIVNISGKELFYDSKSYKPAGSFKIDENRNRIVWFTIALNYDNGTAGMVEITGGSSNDGQWHIAAAEPGSDYDYVMTWVNCYPLWVGGTQVSSENANDVFNDQKVKFTPAVPATDGNEATPATLTLNGYTGSYNGGNEAIKGVISYKIDNYIYQGDGYSDAGIYWDSNYPLMIEYKGNNTVSGKKYGIHSSPGPIILNGTGTLQAAGSDTGIYSWCDISVLKGSVKATGQYGFYSYNKNSVFDPNNTEYMSYINIGNGIKSVEAIGDEKAIYGKTKNDIAGTGWDNQEGTGTKSLIATNADGKELNYKKVLFLGTYTLNYDNGGGSGDMSSMTVSNGDTYTFPECTFIPPRNKTFDHWKMSGVDGIFQPNGQVTITSNCVQNGVITVTAHWKDASKPQPTQAQKVANEIKALSDPVTLADREKVDKAKAAYDALPEAQKKQVPADLVQKLNKAVDTIAVLLVSDQIAGLPEPVTLDDAAAVDAAVEAYLALTDSQKAIFSEMDLQKLIEAETAIGTLRAAGITVKIGKVKNLKGGKVRMQLGNPHYNAAKGKAASGKPALSAQEVTGINEFYIQYSTDKKFKKKVKTKKIKNPKAKTVTIKHLKKGKSYYFRVCTYAKVTNRISGEEKTVKGKWSAKKKVKINK